MQTIRCSLRGIALSPIWPEVTRARREFPAWPPPRYGDGTGLTSRRDDRV
jgi:hypothetical protein